MKISSQQEPCSKCLKKYPDLTNWSPCKACPWIAKTQDLKKEKEKFSSEKTCMECEETLNFLEPEKGKYLCGKVKCLRSYIEKVSKKS
jgi:hypothetical protein